MPLKNKLIIASILGVLLLFLIIDIEKKEPEPKQFQVSGIEARSVLVYELREGRILFAKNENERLPLASLTKLMSATAALEADPELLDELGMALLRSSNQGISSSTEKVAPTEEFVRLMNRKVRNLGLVSMSFSNETGLDLDLYEAGGYGSAKDVNNLFIYMLREHRDLLRVTSKVEKNTNLIASEIPGLLGSKTGLNDLAGGNLVFAFDLELGRPIVITILGSTEDGRFQDARKLISATLEYINQ